jgi:UPF0271 protein
VRLAHVKPHGALYNDAARDERLAEAIARAVSSADSALVLIGLAGSALLDAGRRAGLRVAAEAFADRAYRSDGSLAPRAQAGAVIHDPPTVAEQAIRIARDGRVRSFDGTAEVELSADTLCIHGDTPGAAHLARTVRAALEAAGVRVAALE